jgi:hypothetical protein
MVTGWRDIATVIVNMGIAPLQHSLEYDVRHTRAANRSESQSHFQVSGSFGQFSALV